MDGRRLLVVSSAAVLAGAGAVAGAGILLADRGDRPPGAVDRGATVEVDPQAPALAGRDPVSGDRVSLARVKSKPIVLTVWASWCDACTRQAPALRAFHQRHRKQAALIGLDYQDDPDDAKAFYERFDWTFRSIADPNGRRAARLGVENVPTTLFLDREHSIVHRIPGIATREELEAGLRRITGG